MADMRGLIIETAAELGVDPVDLATVISYETAGTFDPTKRGPTTQWGQHRGLIQWGEPQARRYGVNWDDPVASQLGRDGAVVRYMRDAGVRPGMGLLDLYSAVNAGRVGRYNASDANNGGAPGTVRDKVEQQMDGHRRKASALIGGGRLVASALMEQGVDPGLAHAAAASAPGSPQASQGGAALPLLLGALGGGQQPNMLDGHPLLSAALSGGLASSGQIGVNQGQPRFGVQRGADGLDKFVSM